MTEHDPMEPVLAGVRDVIRAIQAPRRDFADVVARAHAIAPERISEAAVDEAELDADVIGLGRGTANEEEALDGILADARSGMLARIVEHRMRPVPPLRVRPARPVASRGRLAAALWVAGGLIAAAVIAAISLRADRVQRAGDAQPAAQAVDEEMSPNPAREVVEVTPEPRPAPRTRPEQDVEDAVPPPDSSPLPDPAAHPLQPRRDRLRAMADEAQAKWRAGDLAGARSIYARIVAQGGRSRQAELAFSDLFSLAHQLGGTGERRRWWSGYVRRFPNGRFADDAQAGLCRTAPASDRERCWTKYLERKGGAYRSEAQDVIEGGRK